MKKIIAVLSVVFMTLTGCMNNGDYSVIDTEKAGQTALDYLNSKYDSEFELVSSKKDASCGLFFNLTEAYVMSEFTVKGDDSGNTYKVKLCLNEKDKSKYDIVCDNYYGVCAYPWLKKRMDNIFDELPVSEYITSVSESDGFFESDFSVPNEQDTLKEFADSCRLVFDYEVIMPESSYYKDINEDIRKIFRPYFSDDCIHINLSVYTDGYIVYKKADINKVIPSDCGEDYKVCSYSILLN